MDSRISGGAAGATNTTRPLTHPSDCSRGGLAVNATHEESWRPIPGFEGRYEASDLGRIRSVDRVITTKAGVRMPRRGQVLKPWSSDRLSHQSVTLGHDYKDHHLVHVLVLTTFVGPRPEGMEGCHNDGNAANNRLENLRWDTASANQRDRVKHGTHHFGNRTHCKHGHEYSAENTYIRVRSGPRYVKPSHTRVCLTCQREGRRRKKAVQ